RGSVTTVRHACVERSSAAPPRRAHCPMARRTRRLALRRRLRAPGGQRLRELAQRLLELARDDPDLVRLALRDLRQHLQVLVREELGVSVAGVDGREHRLDRLRLALGPEDLRLPLTLGAEDRALLLALGRKDLR